MPSTTFIRSVSFPLSFSSNARAGFVLSRHHLPLQEEAQVSRARTFRASCAADDAEPESWPESEFSCDSEQSCLHRGPIEELYRLDCSDVVLGTCTEVVRRLLIFLLLLENLNILLWVFILLPHTANAGPSSAAE
jgi:hypothetical protein